jgi:uncharacterized OsmC-like protein
MKFEIHYQGELRTEIRHEGSGERIATDAPLDNNGQGRFFSPTDLTASSLAACMMTLIGITAANHNIVLQNMKATAEKTMASNPRRIAQIHIYIELSAEDLTDRHKSVLEAAARNCPVAKSLHPDIEQRLDLRFS